MRLIVRTLRLDHAVLLRCEGRITWGAETTALEQRVRSLLQDLQDVILELSGVTFVDSGGLGLLVRLLSSARKSGRDLKLAAVSPPVRKLLETTCLTSVFRVFGSPEEAVSAAIHSPHSARTGGGPRTGRRILCTDESCDLLSFLRTVLQDAGYSVLSTDNLADAKLLLKCIAPDLLILGPSLQNADIARARDSLVAHARSIPVLTLEADFHHVEAAQAASVLMEKVKRAAA